MFFISYGFWIQLILKARILIFSLELREVVFRDEFFPIGWGLLYEIIIVVCIVNTVAKMDNSCLYQVQSMRSQSHIQPRSLGGRRAMVLSKYGSQSISITWKLVGMQILGPHPTPTEFKTLGVGPSNLCFNKPSRGFWCTLKFENHCVRGISLNNKQCLFLKASLSAPRLRVRDQLHTLLWAY